MVGWLCVVSSPVNSGDEGFSYRLMLADCDNLFTLVPEASQFVPQTHKGGCFIMQDATFTSEGVACPNKFGFAHVLYSKLECEDGVVVCTACTCQASASKQKSMRQLRGICKDQRKADVEKIVENSSNDACIHQDAISVFVKIPGWLQSMETNEQEPRVDFENDVGVKLLVQHGPGIFSVALDGDFLPRAVIFGHRGGGRCSRLEERYCSGPDCDHVSACQASASCEDLGENTSTITPCTRSYPVWRDKVDKASSSMSYLPLPTAQQYNQRQQEEAYGGGSQQQALKGRINGTYPDCLTPEIDDSNSACADCQNEGVTSLWEDGTPINLGDAVIHTVKGNHPSINLIGIKCENCDNMLFPDGRNQALFIKE